MDPVPRRRRKTLPSKRPGSGAQVRAEEGGAESVLGPEDEVEFTVVANRRTGAFRAEGVQLLCKAELRRELGQVRMLLNRLRV